LDCLTCPSGARKGIGGYAPFHAAPPGWNGTVGAVRITRSLDPVFGLDEEAIKAARQWLFEPGTRFGEPVAILVNLALDFNLR